MKRFLFVIAALLVATAGCDKEPCVECAEERPMRRVSLMLGGSALQTKALGVPSLAESNVVRSLLYVFSRTGALVECYSSTDGRFDFYLTDETYDFVVVANKADLPAGGVTKASLLSTVSELSENAVGCFVMVGELNDHLIEADEKITVEVARLVGKVTCTIRTAFTGALAEKAFHVEALFLTNVVGQCALLPQDSIPAAQALWFNRMELEDPLQEGNPAELLSGRVGRRMAASDSLATGLSFYPYPNASPDNHDRENWESRCTRLVVKAQLGGRTTWYPVTLEQVRRNRHYHVDLTVSNYGVEHPEDLLSTYSGIRTTLSVAEWSDGGTLEGLY